MPISPCTFELIFYPEIEKLARANKKAKWHEKNLPSLMPLNSDLESEEKAIFEQEEMAKQRILRELATPNMNQ